ncbi:MAG: fatty acyl-AMP ligase [Alphaproteobacteria bacterium]|jgi:acyl-CoA synthetase (AMP-forming)/AMP-acid ligase II|nr:MAG: fatty acyl-AMP ligase [Alphaproteobacteria bacterium]
MLDSPRFPSFTSLVDLLHHRAAKQPDDRAYIFLSDQGNEEAVLTFADLARGAGEVAARLAHSQIGDRALLLFGPGLDFIVAYFGCLLAGVIAVPMMLPRRNSSLDSSASIVANCSPRFAITNAQVSRARPDVVERFEKLKMEWLIVDSERKSIPGRDHQLRTPGPDDIAFLQYTSGSSSDPKGVMVTHRNLIENLEMIRVTLDNTARSTYASWVPLYHDMGLILNVLQSLYIGAACLLLAPVTFIQRPLRWLRAIHHYGAEVAGGPNFAFDLCVQRFRADQVKDLDLSCWKVAINGAEPVRADTIERFTATFRPYGFDPRATNPLYGMAEATLLISGAPRGSGPVIRTVSRDAFQRHELAPAAGADDAHRVVGCGRNLIGQRIAIVDPESRRRLAADQIGEVWVGGPHVCKGYWHNPEATTSTFQARIEGEDEPWLRTGDLGFMDEAGELFITGRIKDLIIVRGINYYPQDIENTVYDSHPALRRNCGAAFSVLTEENQEKVVLVQEVERTHRRDIEIEEIVACIREAVANEHEIALDSIVLIRPGSIPKTTSGKIQRSAARRMWLQNSFDTVDALSI